MTGVHQALSRSMKDCLNTTEAYLIDGEEHVWDLGTPDGGLSEDISEHNVVQVADIASRRVREGQGISPEEPLEAHDGCRHHTQPYE
jgi:hypothetical protein